MQKYIAVVNPKTDDDELANLIGKDISAALFSISHQNYGMAAKTIERIKNLSKKYNRPMALIQEVTDSAHPLDLEFGAKTGVDWILTNSPRMVELAKKIKKEMPVIFKSTKKPKNLKVDALVTLNGSKSDAFIEYPSKTIYIKHILPTSKHAFIESIRHFADHAHVDTIAVSDLLFAQGLSSGRANKKIVFASKDQQSANQASIYWGMQPLFVKTTLESALKNANLVKPGERVLDATAGKHVTIHSII